MKTFFKIILILLPAMIIAQPTEPSGYPMEAELLGNYALKMDLKRPQSGSAYGAGAGFKFKRNSGFSLNFNISINTFDFEQNDVLDEWNWAYWEDTYIEFIPGAYVEEVNRTLRYTDSTQYWAVFKPEQSMNEFSFMVGSGYQYDFNENLSIGLDFNFGVSIYERKLLMREDWIKRIILSVDSIEINNTMVPDTVYYDYKFDLVHSAPSYKGIRFVINPAVNLRYRLSDFSDFVVKSSFVYYLSRNQIEWLEDLAGTKKADEVYFPVKDRLMIQAGVVFKY